MTKPVTVMASADYFGINHRTLHKSFYLLSGPDSSIALRFSLYMPENYVEAVLPTDCLDEGLITGSGYLSQLGTRLVTWEG